MSIWHRNVRFVLKMKNPNMYVRHLGRSTRYKWPCLLWSLWRDDSTPVDTSDSVHPQTNGATCWTTGLWSSHTDIWLESKVKPMTAFCLQIPCLVDLRESSACAPLWVWIACPLKGTSSCIQFHFVSSKTLTCWKVTKKFYLSS